MKKPDLRLVHNSIREEIEGKPLEGIPPYKSPISQTLRCVCGHRYLVYLGAPSLFDDRACEAAREDAGRRGCQFIDARLTPFMNCECGQLLDFSSECSLTIQ
jgi:hypothetical protein